METKDVINELSGEIRQFQEESVKPIQERLASLEERDSSPGDVVVTDLEKRLIDTEQKISEMNEELRLAQVNGGLIVAPEKPEADVFRGAFIKNIDEARSSFAETRVLDSALFSSDAGKLSTETADAFIDFFVNEQTTLGRCQVRRMSGPRGTIDRLNFAAEKIRLATESTTQAVSDSVTISRRNLVTKEIIWTEDISQTFLEDNIARGNVESHIASKLGMGFGTDMNSLGWRGDTAETNTTFLGVADGWNHLMEADGDVNDVDLSGNVAAATIAQDNFSSVLDGLPSKYRTLPDLAFFVTPGTAQVYANEYATRATAGGDSVLIGGFPNMRYFGIQIIPEPAMLTKAGDTGADALGSKMLLAPLSNLVFGIQRDLTVDAEWVPRKRVVEYTLSARIDFNYAFGGVMSLGNQINAAGL